MTATKRKYYLVKFAPLILITLVFVVEFLFSPIKPKPYGDSIFNVEAKIIANNLKGLEDTPPIKFEHSIIPSLFYVIPALLSNSAFESTVYFNLAIFWNLCSFLLAIWLYLKAFELKDLSSQLLFTLFIIIIPYFIYYNLFFSSEPISFLLLSLVFYLIPKKSTEINITRLILIGGITGILVANRPNFILFIPIVFFLFILTKKWLFLIIPIISFLTFFLVNQLYRVNNQNESKDKVVFLLEQIHGGQFFLRTEFTDWSFFNDEFRPNSTDYNDYQASREKLQTEIANGTAPRKAYINEIAEQLSNNLVKSLLHPIKKFIHGNSIHIGSKTPGKLNTAYLKKYYLTFLLNVILNILNWLIILLGIYVIAKHYHDNELLSLFIITTLISFNFFNMLSASEQRYLFPTKIIYIIFTIKFIVNRYSLNNWPIFKLTTA